VVAVSASVDPEPQPAASEKARAVSGAVSLFTMVLL
jgi:hypothetical protein